MQGKKKGSLSTAEIKLAALATFVSVGIFFVDMITPLGVADATSYIAVVLITLWLRENYHTYIAIGISIVFTALGLLLSPDGESMTVTLTNRSLAIAGIIVAGIVVVQYKKIQRRVQTQNEQLETLANRLQMANKELESFAYVASHDLQEPLRKIRAFSERLQEAEGSRMSVQGRDYLERIVDAGVRMSRLIQDLLSYSRMVESPFEKVELEKEINDVVSDLQIRIESTGAKIHSDNLPVIYGDRTQVRQLFQNLIANSLKFGREGVPPEIEIRVKTDSKPGYAEFSLKDNGIGFDQKYADQIFGFFQRLEGKKYEGSGIGLAVCKKIVTRHGGLISAESKPGEGTTFHFSLPINEFKIKR